MTYLLLCLLITLGLGLFADFDGRCLNSRLAIPTGPQWIRVLQSGHMAHPSPSSTRVRRVVSLVCCSASYVSGGAISSKLVNTYIFWRVHDLFRKLLDCDHSGWQFVDDVDCCR